MINIAYLVLQHDPGKGPGQEKAAGERCGPCKDNFLYRGSLRTAASLDCSGAPEGGHLGVGRGDREAEQGGQQQAAAAGQVSGQPGRRGQAGQPAAQSVDDSPPADGGAKGHTAGTQGGCRQGHQKDAGGFSRGEGLTQQEQGDKLLPILRAVKKGGEDRAGDLSPADDAGGEVQPGQPVRGPAAGQGAQRGGEDQTNQDFSPGGRIDAAEIAVESHTGPGNSSQQGMAFAGWDTEPPGQHRPQDDSQQRGLKGGQGHSGIGPEVRQSIDSLRHQGAEQAHDHGAQKIKKAGKENRFPEGESLGGDHGGNGVGRVGPTVDQ